MTVIVTSILSNTDSLYRFELLLPDNWKESPCPVYIQLAGTGDHVSFCRLTEARIISVSSQYFWRRRRLFGLPLVKSSSIGSLILENPFCIHLFS